MLTIARDVPSRHADPGPLSILLRITPHFAWRPRLDRARRHPFPSRPDKPAYSIIDAFDTCKITYRLVAPISSLPIYNLGEMLKVGLIRRQIWRLAASGRAEFLSKGRSFIGRSFERSLLTIVIFLPTWID